MNEIEKNVKRLAIKYGSYAKDHVSEIKESFKEGDVRNIVTNIDIDVSNKMKAEIAELFPDHNFSSEEDVSLLDKDAITWVLDPIDGTSNYVRRVPLYSCCVTVMKGGEVMYAAVYCPTTDECFSLGEESSYCNDDVMEISSVQLLKDAHVNFHPGRNPLNKEWAIKVNGELLTKAKKTMNLGSSGLDLCYVADGRTDVLIYGSITTIDIAGAIQMVRRAGGEVYDYETKTLVEYSGTPQKIIATANRQILNNYFENIED